MKETGSLPMGEYTGRGQGIVTASGIMCMLNVCIGTYLVYTYLRCGDTVIAIGLYRLISHSLYSSLTFS